MLLEARRPGVLFCGVVLLAIACFADFGVRSVALATEFLLGRVAATESGCWVVEDRRARLEAEERSARLALAGVAAAARQLASSERVCEGVRGAITTSTPDASSCCDEVACLPEEALRDDREGVEVEVCLASLPFAAAPDGRLGVLC